MKRSVHRLFLVSFSALVLVSTGLRARAQWTPPTEEELKMTAQPEVPGAAAVYLFREEITDDQLHVWTKYARIKVLTERGKDYANIELHQYDAGDNGGYSVSDIQGRTIHPDGTIIPFTGKPYQKVIEKSQGYKETAKVFTLPDVEVGSIIEFRYSLRYDDNMYIPPDWFVQSELYTRKAHYLWKPTDKQLVSKGEHGEELTSGIAWAPILPEGYTVKPQHMADGQQLFELTVHDIKPTPDEEFMPPFKSLTYRVMFYYATYRSTDEYWKSEGKKWAKDADKFIGPNGKVKEAVAALVAPTDTEEQKLRKIYAAVMKLDNSSYSRAQSAQEEKAQGFGPAKSTDDIWTRKRGDDDEIAELFVAMARAAGMKGYVMAVTNRDRDVFVPNYMSFSQLNDLIAIVTVGGKEQYFDPGMRYCPYGHLAWKHSDANGLRQTDGGSALAQTPDEPYTNSRTQRVADLKMDDHGEVTGTVRMTWTGAPALSWRTRYLLGDQTGLQRDLHDSVENLLPAGMDIETGAITNLDDYEQPLSAVFQVKGAVGSPTGKRLLVPADIFVANEKPTFPHDKRETPIFFNYANIVQDATRYTFPASLTLESSPAKDEELYQGFAAYKLDPAATPTSITTQRRFELGTIFYKTDEYPNLRNFYKKFETKDQEPAVLKVATASATPAGE
ncbi:MAG TPA: DUF3857 domain-containing protein [Acidobacteriaceae bacterium]|nr:DUF3857 domain-containing protein [Acidobacteriaceae bacterium]